MTLVIFGAAAGAFLVPLPPFFAGCWQAVRQCENKAVAQEDIRPQEHTSTPPRSIEFANGDKEKRHHSKGAMGPPGNGPQEQSHLEGTEQKSGETQPLRRGQTRALVQAARQGRHLPQMEPRASHHRCSVSLVEAHFGQPITGLTRQAAARHCCARAASQGPADVRPRGPQQHAQGAKKTQPARHAQHNKAMGALSVDDQ